MIGSIQSSSFFPQLTIAEPKQILKNATKIAPIALAAIALANLPKVDGGPLTEAACIIACTGSCYVYPVAILYLSTCYQACMLLGFAPTP